MSGSSPVESMNSNSEEHIICVLNEQASMDFTTPSRQSSSSSNDVVVGMVTPEDEISASTEDTATSGEIKQCRFCHEEDNVRHLEAPCGCAGTLRYAHRNCTTAWCNTKGNIICEICHQPYRPDYSVTTEEDSSSTLTARLELESGSPSTPTTITVVQSPLQQPQPQPQPQQQQPEIRRPFDLSRWAHLMVPCRGLLYATLLVLFLVVLVVNDVFTFTKATKKAPKKAFNILFVVIMILLAPLSLLSCLYECQSTIARHFEERNPPRAMVAIRSNIQPAN